MEVHANSSSRSSTVFCFAFLASMPGLYRKKCKACQHDNHFNSKKCKRRGGALDIQSPGAQLNSHLRYQCFGYHAVL